MSNLAGSYVRLNRHADAVKLGEDTLAAQKRVLPPDHPDTLGSMHNLAVSYFKLNCPAEAVKLLEETLAARKRTLPPDHADTLMNMNNLGKMYVLLGRHAEAQKVFLEMQAALKQVRRPDHAKKAEESAGNALYLGWVKALAGKKLVHHRTEMTGGTGGGPFENVPKDPTLLRGFTVWTGQWNNRMVIQSVQPLFWSATGTSDGAAWGEWREQSRRIVAKDGYAVGGIVAKTINVLAPNAFSGSDA
jgi:hypothetical protein